MDKNGYTLTVLSDVFAKDEEINDDTDWLWPGHIPSSSVGMFDGDPGLGKSMVTMDLAARVTRGAAWPDGTKGHRPADVLLMFKEDTQKTVAKRLRAAGADFKRCVILEDIAGEQVRLPRDIKVIEEIVVARKVKLIVIDPVMAFLQVTAYQDQKVREAMSPLAQMCERTGVTLIFVRHLTKGGGKNAKQAGGGSMGLLGACRFGYIFTQDPEDPKRRIFAVTKFNLAEEPPSFRYHIEGTARGPHALYDGPVEMSADDLMSTRGLSTVQRKERDEVVAFLEDYVKEYDGIIHPIALFDRGKDAGFTQKMLRTARAKIGMRSQKIGSHWYWVSADFSGPYTVPAWMLDGTVKPEKKTTQRTRPKAKGSTKLTLVPSND